MSRPQVKTYVRPIVLNAVAHVDSRAAGHLLPLAGGPLAFNLAEITERGSNGRMSRGIVPAAELADRVGESYVARLTSKRSPILGFGFDRPRLMGVLNVTPDSFSDGGRFQDFEAAIAHGRAMFADGADIVDVGGESTRPGAETVAIEAEMGRVVPVIAALADVGPLSIDSRKAGVMTAALDAGAAMINDVSALTFDRESLALAARREVPVVLMHARGDPKTMQNDPRYDDVLLDVYDYLEERIAACEAAGIDRAGLIVDPGLGFGKTLAHNVSLMAALSLFHGLGCALLVGASRKSFVGALMGGVSPGERLPGSLAAAFAAAGQGVQVLRVHDVAATRRALDVYLSASGRGASP